MLENKLKKRPPCTKVSLMQLTCDIDIDLNGLLYICMYLFVHTDDYGNQQRVAGQLSHELQSVLSYANVPLSQSAAYSNNTIYNATTASVYGAPGQPVNTASGYGTTVATGHPSQQVYSGKTHHTFHVI